VNETIKFTVDPSVSSPLPTNAITASTAGGSFGCDPFGRAPYIIAATLTPSGNVNDKCSSNPAG
jgi:hypothetical protein